MGEIINLRRVRRERIRQTAAQEAAENRARHGQSKTARTAAAKEDARLQQTVDGARLPPKEG
jgi:hypothetical protein